MEPLKSQIPNSLVLALEFALVHYLSVLFSAEIYLLPSLPQTFQSIIS